MSCAAQVQLTLFAACKMGSAASDVILAGRANFLTKFHAIATIAGVLLACQTVQTPVWSHSGDRFSAVVAGPQIGPYLIWGLVALTALSVLVV